MTKEGMTGPASWWVVRGHSPDGDVVEEVGTEAEAAASVPVEARVPDRCSFCGKDRAAVAGMVAGPAGAGVAICNECVALCAEILGPAPAPPA